MARPSAATLSWTLRSMLSETGRKRARVFADVLLRPVGSINGARRRSASVAVTFDDGPDPSVTPALLDLMSRRGVRATFFVLTDRAVRHADLVRRMSGEGHEVGLHCDRHDRLTLISPGEVWRRVTAARRELAGITGRPVRFFRPPFGAQTLSTYLISRACGLEPVVWGPYAEDWVDGSPEEVAARGLAALKGGDVLLLHDGMERPAGEALPTFDRVRAFELILDGMASKGLRPTTVGELIAAGGARRTAWFRP